MHTISIICGLQKLNTLNLRHSHPPLNPRNHFSTVLIKTNWYTISCKYAVENGLKEPTDMSKNTAKGQPESTLPEGHSGSTDDVQVLRARIDELEKQLRYEKMRAEAYNTMIDLAEDAFKVPIRKKSGAKR